MKKELYTRTERGRDCSKSKTALEISEARYRRLFESAYDGILIVDAESGVINDVNPFLVDLLHSSKEEVLGKKLWEIGAFKDIKASREAFVELQTKEYVRYEDLPLETRDGRSINVEFISNVYYVDGTRVIQCNIRDITQRRKAEEAVSQSLKEKEGLLRELHHRVKNNMQIISSMLQMQLCYSKNKVVVETFKKIQERIGVMALVHQKLCESKDFMSIDIREYINDLIGSLLSAYGVDQKMISTHVDVEKVFLPIDIAVPCGLIVNELLTNCIKYAFPKKRKGEIGVMLRVVRKNVLELVIQDNGVGFPEDVDLCKTKTLGLSLVASTVENQLGGTLTVDHTHGARFKSAFKIKGIGDYN